MSAPPRPQSWGAVRSGGTELQYRRECCAAKPGAGLMYVSGLQRSSAALVVVKVAADRGVHGLDETLTLWVGDVRLQLCDATRVHDLIIELVRHSAVAVEPPCYGPGAFRVAEEHITDTTDTGVFLHSF